MRLSFQPFLIAAALLVPSACPAMAMEIPAAYGPVRGDMGGEMMGTMSSVDETAMAMPTMQAMGEMEEVDPAIPMCCLGQAPHHEPTDRDVIAPLSAGIGDLPSIEGCEWSAYLDAAQDIVPVNATPPPRLFEERSVMRRE